MKLILSSRAQVAIDEIDSYYTHRGDTELADRITEEIFTTIRKLARSPYHRRTRDELPDRFRRIYAGYYAIYYEIDEQADAIYVYEVRNGSRKPLSASTHRQLSRLARNDNIELN